MRIFFKLLRMLMNGTNMDAFGSGFMGKKKKNKLSRSLGKSGVAKTIFQIILSILFIGLIGSLGVTLGNNFAKLPHEYAQAGVRLIINNITTVSLFLTLMISFMAVPAILFFAKDTETLLILPIKPTTIVMAKLTHSYVSIALPITAFLSLPILLTMGYITKMPVHYYLGSVLLVLLTPIVPVALISIFIIVLMRFAKWARNQDRYMMISQIVLLVGFFGIYFTSIMSSVQTDPSASASNPYATLLASDKTSFSVVGTTLSWMSSFMTSAITRESALYALLFVLICLSAAILLALISQKLYLRIVLSAANADAKKRKLTKKELGALSVSATPIKALTANEWRTIRRTPAFAMNIIGSSVISVMMMIFFAIIFFSVGSKTSSFSSLRDTFENLNPELWGYIFVAASVAITFFFAAQSSMAASSALSREGKTAFLLKLYPVSPMNIYMIKWKVAFILMVLPLVFWFVVARIILPIPLILYAPAVLLSFLVVLICTILGTIIDYSFPKLQWNSEMQAVKNNFNAFALMIIGWALAGLTVYSAILAKRHDFGFYTPVAILSCVLILILAVLICLVRPALKRGFKQIS